MIRHKTKTVLTLFTVVLLVSCTASKHLGTTTIQKPTMKESNEEAWFIYWQDQLDANGGYGLTPFSSEYPQSAVEGYNIAKVDWDKKVQKAKLVTTCVWGATGVGLTLLSSSIILSMMLYY